MFTARAARQLGRARFSSALVFTKRAWLGIVTRSNLTLATRFVPAAESPRRNGACLYVLLRGELIVDGSELRFDGPAAFVLSEHHLEGASGARPLTYRASGSPSEAIEVHLADEDLQSSTVRHPIELPIPVSLDAASWMAAERVLDHVQHGQEAEVESAVTLLLSALATAGIVAPRVAAGATAPLPFEKLWRAIGPLARRFALSATMDELSKLAEASPRQLDRYMSSFFEQFTMLGGGRRTATRLLRLKLAILFLSAEDVSIAEVARTVGYGSADAMARALRDAGCESPSAIRAALRDARG